MEELFPEYGGNNITSFQATSWGVWAHVVVKSKTGNLLARTVLEDVKRLDTYVRSVTALADDGTTILFSDICAAYYGECSVDGDLFFNVEFLTAVDSNSVTYPEFATTTSGSENYESNIGGIITTDDSGAYLRGMEYIWLAYHLSSDTQDVYGMATKWMEKFIKSLEGFSSDYFEVAYSHISSLDDGLDKNLTGDIALFAVTITLMITYACCATASARYKSN